jgi:exodeoxyribonuclease VII large subunit
MMKDELPLFAGTRATDDVCSVSELTARLRRVLETDFSNVGVQGEISGLARPRSGHVYFSIKDANAQIKAVIWKTATRRIAFELQDGMAVRAWGNVTVYEPRGEYQIVVSRIEPAGLGALELAFRQTVARLEAEGLFSQEHKRPIPQYPNRIAVVTSPTGAAVRDVIRVIGGRWPLAELIVVPSRVQGAGSAIELAQALIQANSLPDVDFIILTRGGGSLEDLWAFNEEVLARAIVQSALPIVSAVGHEVDITVADLAADLRAATPSAAGSTCTPDINDVKHRLDVLSGRLKRVVRNTTKHATQDLRALQQRLLHALERRWATERRRLDLMAQRADRAMRTELDRRLRVTGAFAAKLDALSPLAVLARGYSITQLAEGGRVVRAPRDVTPGSLLTTRLAEGTIMSRAE